MNDQGTINHLSKRLSSHLQSTMIKRRKIAAKQLWDQSDIALITYGGTIRSDDEPPLQTLHRFLKQHIGQSIGIVHILPFFPYSSDDGFGVIDYLEVDENLGDWTDIEAIAADYRLMADLVINHGSSKSAWFRQFLNDEAPGKDYYYTADPSADLGQVVRPRSHPLLTLFQTASGDRHVWSTFSTDQVDFDFSNPDLFRQPE